MSWLTKFQEKAITDPIAAGSLLASVAALGISIASFVIAQNAQQQAAMQFRQERQLVLTGTFQRAAVKGTCSSIKAAPIGQDFKLQRGKA
jgi:uncharacterized protein HemX